MQGIADRFAIEQILADIAHTVDAQDIDAYAALYDERGTLELLGPGDQGAVATYIGIEQILAAAHAAFGANLLGHLTRTHVSGIRFDALGADHARTHCLFLVTRQTPTDPRPRSWRSGIWATDYRRTAAGWRIWLHRAFPDQPVGGVELLRAAQAHAR